MEECFTFQWRGCVSDVGFIFKWGGGGHPMGGINFDGAV